MPGIEYTSGNRSVGYAAIRNADGTWRAEVRAGHVVPGGESRETEDVPGGPWVSEEAALEAAHSWATKRWPPGGQNKL
jgi:hypothetical protein